MRKPTEIRENLDHLKDAYFTVKAILEEELALAVKHEQDVCTHHSYEIAERTDSYFEEGRMRSTVEWVTVYCKRCGKVLGEKA